MNSQQVLLDTEPTAFFAEEDVHVSLWGLSSGLSAARIMDHATQVQMAEYARTLKIRSIFAINGEESNTTVVRATDEHFPNHGWFEKHRIEIFSGAKVDGLYGLGRGQAFWIRSADCPTIAVCYPSGKMAVLHAGRRSLLPSGWPDTLSVIQTLSQRMPLFNAEVHLVCGVGPESYPVHDDHPVYGPRNAALRRDVMRRWGKECVRETHSGPSLSLIDVARAQLVSCGVSERNVHWDGFDTVANRNDKGNFVWASAIRGDVERNHVLVANV